MITEITQADQEAIARLATKYMGANPDAQSEGFDALNWQVMYAKVQESFAVNKATREVLQAKQQGGPERIAELFAQN